MEPVGTNNQAPSPPISDQDKKLKFEEIVNIANKILSPEIHMDLSTRTYNPKKDALAFLVEHAPIEPRFWKLMMDQFIKNLGEKDKADATYLIDDSVQLALQNAVTKDIERKPDGAQNWRDYMQFYAQATPLNQERRKKHEPVNFSGVPRSLLPQWYLKDHGELNG